MWIVHTVRAERADERGDGRRLLCARAPIGRDAQLDLPTAQHGLLPLLELGARPRVAERTDLSSGRRPKHQSYPTQSRSLPSPKSGGYAEG
jgi:hypothetical protein